MYIILLKRLRFDQICCCGRSGTRWQYRGTPALAEHDWLKLHGHMIISEHMICMIDREFKTTWCTIPLDKIIFTEPNFTD